MSSLDASDWRNDALCAQTDPELYFDPDSEGVHGRGWKDQQDAVAAALRTCDQCIVRLDCLIEAIENGERWGIWGGTTQKERAALVNEYEDDSSDRTAWDIALDHLEGQEAATNAAKGRAA